MRVILFLFSLQTLFSLEKIGMAANWSMEFPKNPESCGNDKFCSALLERGYWPELFVLGEQFATVVIHNRLSPQEMVNIFAQVPKEKLVLFIWEPPVVLPDIHEKKFHKNFGKIFTWDDDLVDNKLYFKFFYPNMRPMSNDLPSFQEKKFCALFATNLTSTFPGELYSERRRAIKFFEMQPTGIFDLYGRLWEKEHYKNYRGPVPDKIAVLKNYKFTICYENASRQKGYITEKIFDAFHAGVVPVYWGAPNIETYIPKDCFIDKRNFTSYDALYTFLQEITEEEYETYLNNIRNFLSSPEAQLFTADHFLTIFCRDIL